MEPSDDDEAAPAAAAGAGRALVLSALVAACVVGVAASPLRELLSPARVAGSGWYHELGALAPIAFVAASALGVACAVPRIVFAALAGALFGLAWGLALAQLATVIGCTLNFAYARALGRRFVEQRLAARLPRLRALLDLAGREGLLANVLLRALPFGNAFSLNLLMAMSPVRPSTFVLGTAIGALPSTTVYTLIGSGARGETAARLGLALGFLLLWSGAYVLFLRRRARRRRLERAPATGGATDRAGQRVPS